MRASASRTSGRVAIATGATDAAAGLPVTSISSVSRSSSGSSGDIPRSCFSCTTATSARPAASSRPASKRRSSTSSRSRSSGGVPPASTRARTMSHCRSAAATSSSATTTSRTAAAATPYCIRTSATSTRSRSATANCVACSPRSAVCTRPSRRKRSKGHWIPMLVRLSVPPGSSRRSNVSVGFGRSPPCCCSPRAASMSDRTARSDGSRSSARAIAASSPRPERSSTYCDASADGAVPWPRAGAASAIAAMMTVMIRRGVLIAHFPGNWRTRGRQGRPIRR